ncbi:MAG: LL-diaminopimelate aminotransferase [Candidatus Omnitrophica bacterium]|nr:LL-diaminopimelate aminotransferase [Candidatus Omnitrophota bacterium]
MNNLSKRLQSLPPYLFVEIDKAKRKAREEGRDVIDLGIGDPDQPTPEYIIRSLQAAAEDPANHRYALDAGMPALRREIAEWFRKRFGVAFDPQNEILPTIGSKEAIAHLPLAFLNSAEVSLVPDPCYPPYRNGTTLAGGVPQMMPLRPENAFLPDYTEVPREVLSRARLLYLNYPNNPTAACADKDFYAQTVDFARRNGLIIVSDLAYSEIAYDGYLPPSIFEVEEARECAIELHSLSKTFNMTGWRIGWACGNSRILTGLAKVKANVDSGIFSAVQVAAITALKESDEHIRAMRAMYQKRRDTLLAGLAGLGWEVPSVKATFYVWIKVPGENDSIRYASRILREADIVVTPGVGFGEAAEGYIRMALTVPEERLREAVERLGKLS